jgi:ribokinase
MSKIVVVGSINMDLVVRSPRFALGGETILGHAFHTIPGGKGANQAVAARRMGAEVAMIGRVGGDEFGLTLRRSLSAEGINTECLQLTPAVSTGVALITVDDDGENTIIVVPGANGQLTVDDIEGARHLIAEADILLMQLEIPLPVVERAAQIASKTSQRRVTVILNAAPARALHGDLLSLVDYLVVNETEALLVAGALDGAAGSSTLSPEEAARTLLMTGVRNVVVTLGAEGSMLVSSAGQNLAVPAYIVRPVDTTAAGDGFAGAFSVALADGLPAAEALRWGNAEGALVVTREGAQPSLPTRSEVEQLIASRQQTEL